MLTVFLFSDFLCATYWTYNIITKDNVFKLCLYHVHTIWRKFTPGQGSYYTVGQNATQTGQITDIYCGVTMGCNILYYIQLPHNMPQCIALEQCNTHTEDEAVYEPQCYLTVFGRLAHCGEVFFFLLKE